jgi:hypothetical protein
VFGKLGQAWHPRDVLATEAALQLAKLIEVNYWLGVGPLWRRAKCLIFRRGPADISGQVA